MTRPKEQELIEKEARLQGAMAAVSSKQHTVPSAACAFNVPRQTLSDWIIGNPPRNKAHKTEQLLSHAEEKELVQWITRLAITGYPPRYETLHEMTEEIRKRHIKNIKKDGLQLVQYDDISKQ